QANATSVRMPSKESSCTSSQPRHSLLNLKLSSTLHLWRYIWKMRTACACLNLPITQQHPGVQSGVQQAHLDQPDRLGEQHPLARSPHIRVIGELDAPARLSAVTAWRLAFCWPLLRTSKLVCARASSGSLSSAWAILPLCQPPR